MLVYLAAEEVEELLARVGELSAAGSCLAFEVEHLDSDRMRAQAHRMPTMRQYTELWKGELPDTPGWLRQHGWHTRFDDRTAVNASYGRAAAGPATGGFITATRT